MQTKRGAALLGLGMVVLACSSGPGGAARGPDAGAPGLTPPIKTDGGIECPKGFRLFNGDCRLVCTATTECGDDTHCISVDEDDDALCLPYAECAYLGDDTQCVASGGAYGYTRGGMSTFYPYLSTPGADPNQSTGFDDPYFYGGGQGGPCAGDAKWIATPAKPPVGCNGKHTVTRCRLFYDRCELVTGTTREFVQP